jgi:hypothetical protein
MRYKNLVAGLLKRVKCMGELDLYSRGKCGGGIKAQEVW